MSEEKEAFKMSLKQAKLDNTKNITNTERKKLIQQAAKLTVSKYHNVLKKLSKN
jgi:uncharacterized membrane protein YgcG